MIRPPLPHALLGLVLSLSAGCDTGRRVSPWGAGVGPKLGDYVEKPDLGAHLARIDQETSALGLTSALDLTVEDERGETFVLRTFEGENRLGARTTATRIATGHGVIVAVGPSKESDPDTPTEFVRAVTGPGGPIGFPRDANVDGSLEILLRSERGELMLLSLSSRGSRTITVASPTHGADLDRESRLQFIREVGCVRATRGTNAIRVLKGACEPTAEGVIVRPLLVPLAYLGDRFDRAATSEAAWHAAKVVAKDAEMANAAGLARDVLRLEADYHRAMLGEDVTTATVAAATTDVTVLKRAAEELRELAAATRFKGRERGPVEDPTDAPEQPR